MEKGQCTVSECWTLHMLKIPIDSSPWSFVLFLTIALSLLVFMCVLLLVEVQRQFLPLERAQCTNVTMWLDRDRNKVGMIYDRKIMFYMLTPLTHLPFLLFCSSLQHWVFWYSCLVLGRVFFSKFKGSFLPPERAQCTNVTMWLDRDRNKVAVIYDKENNVLYADPINSFPYSFVLCLIVALSLLVFMPGTR